MSENPVVPVLSHTEVARDLLQRIRAVLEAAGSTTLLQAGHGRKFVHAATLPDEFLEAVAVALEAYQNLAAASEANAAEIRDVVAYSRALRPVVDELRLATAMLAQSINVKRAGVGQQALKTYSLAKGFNRPNDKAMLVPHITAMQRALGKRRKSTAAATPTAPPTPEPVVPVEKKTA